MREPTPAEIEEARLRLLALGARMNAAKLELAAQMVRTGAAMRAFMEAFQDGLDQELADHPDIAELNVQFDARYSMHDDG